MVQEAGNNLLKPPHQLSVVGNPSAQSPDEVGDGDIVYSTLSNEAVRRCIAQHYALGTPLECSLHYRGINDIYALHDPERQFAIRLSRANWRNREAISAELNAMEHLRRRGVDVVVPIARTDGTFVTQMLAPEGLRNGVVFQWANGRAPKYMDPAHGLTYGRLLGRLHAAADDLPPNPARLYMSVEYVLGTSMEFIRERLRRLPRVTEGLELFSARLRSKLDYAVAQGLDWGFCHGDVYPDNARIDGDRMVLFDFDYCGSGWRLLDLACFRTEARRRGLDDAAAWAPFIKGYLEFRPQMANSLKFLAWFMMLRHIWIAGQWCKFVAEGAVEYVPEEFFEDIVPFCERLEADIKADS